MSHASHNLGLVYNSFGLNCVPDHANAYKFKWTIASIGGLFFVVHAKSYLCLILLYTWQSGFWNKYTSRAASYKS